MALETPLLKLHISANAQISEYFGTLLPANFGDVAAEYRAAQETVVLADANYLAFFSFSGPDRQRYVNAVLTSNVRDLQTGQGAVGLLLTPQGHILAEVGAYVLQDRILASSHAMVRERTFATFEKFIIMDDVVLEDLTSATGTLSAGRPSMGALLLIGPRAAGLIAEVSGVEITAMPEFGHVETSFGAIPCRVIRQNYTGTPVARLPDTMSVGMKPDAMIIVPREHLSELWQELERRVRAHGGLPSGMEALNAIRLESGVAWFGHDYDDKQIPHEAGLETSHISYVKGCYTGQEIVERVRSRGHANRRLTELQFFSNAPPVAGTKLFVPGTPGVVATNEVGHVTSATFSPRLARPIGLGYVRRENASLGTQLDAAGTPAEVIAPPAIAEKSVA